MSDPTPPPLENKRSSFIYIAIVVVVGLLFFSAAQQINIFLDNEQTRSFHKLVDLALSSQDSIALIGSSTSQYVSACDQDKRKLAPILADDIHRPVADLTFGGQLIARSVNLASLVSRYGAPKDIVLVIGITELDQRVTLPYTDLVLFTWLNPTLSDFKHSNPWDFIMGLSKQPAPHELGFTFDSVTYPDYRGIFAKWFTMEAKEQTCPETLTHDPIYNRAYYWWNYVAEKTRFSVLDMIVDLNTTINERHKNLYVVIAPINYELIDTLDPSWRTQVEDREHKAVDYLRARNVNVIDPTHLSSNDFGSRWCACGHLMETGRRRLASDIENVLLKPSRQSPPQGEIPNGF